MVTSNKKALSARQAQACEEALNPRCRCRCGGALHGAKRKGFEEGRAFYEDLPEDDPHHIKPDAEDEIEEECPKQLKLFG